MWNYRIKTGEILGNGLRIGTGYSGCGDGRNNPALCPIHDVGPIPPGRYRIGPAYTHPELGPCVMNLEPLLGTDTHGRSLFRIHGDNVRHDASHGCIVTGPAQRACIAKSSERVLEVTE